MTDMNRVSLSAPHVDDRRVAQWQDIKTAPKDGTDVLLCLYDGTITAAGWDGSRQEWVPCGLPWRLAIGAYVTGIPPHWQALPPAPTR